MGDRSWSLVAELETLNGVQLLGVEWAKRGRWRRGDGRGVALIGVGVVIIYEWG